jgi:hypothetical protein
MREGNDRELSVPARHSAWGKSRKSVTARKLLSLTIGAVLGMSALNQTASHASETAKGDQVLNAILPPVVGRKACFSRTYDGTHLRQHPNQQVTAMTFELRYVQVPGSGTRQYVFGMSVKARAQPRLLYTSGFCETNSDVAYPGANLCAVACDGGGVSIKKVGNADAIYVYLETPSEGIFVGKACGAEHDGNIGASGIRLEPGTDDKVFRLDSVAVTTCQTLEK